MIVYNLMNAPNRAEGYFCPVVQLLKCLVLAVQATVYYGRRKRIVCIQ